MSKKAKLVVHDRYELICSASIAGVEPMQK
jgi:hypothetical protein